VYSSNRGKERKEGTCWYLTYNLKADSSVYHTNQTKKIKREKQNKKTDELIKSRNGPKNP